MSFLLLGLAPDRVAARRAFLGRAGVVLSGAAVALLAGRDALATTTASSAESDTRILNTALGAELEAIAAYQVGAESGLLQKPVLDLAVTFQGHHKEHAEGSLDDDRQARRQAGGGEASTRVDAVAALIGGHLLGSGTALHASGALLFAFGVMALAVG